MESLVELVRIPSVGGTDAEIEVQEHTAEVLEGLDTDVDRWDIDLDELRADPWYPGDEVERTAAVGVVGTTAGEGLPGLVLCGHLDVVPPGDFGTWLGTDPFSAEIRDGALFGRGACDMKAGAAANLAVLRTLRDAGVRVAVGRLAERRDDVGDHLLRGLLRGGRLACRPRGRLRALGRHGFAVNRADCEMGPDHCLLVFELLVDALQSTASWWAAGSRVRFVADVGVGASWPDAH